MMQYWNNFGQRASHLVAEARILRNMNKGWDNLTKKEQKYLLELGIDKDTLGYIAEQQAKFGETVSGTHISNSRLWEQTPTGQRARQAFNNAIRLEVRKGPVMVGQGDIPRFFAKSDMRRSMMNLKGFSYAAISKIAMNIASRHDANAMTGLFTLVGMGMVVQALKDKIAGRESNYSLDEWIMKGIDRSGVGGMLLDPFVQAGRAYDNAKKYGAMATYPQPLNYIVGPNASILEAGTRGIIDMGKGKMSKQTEYQLKMLLPFHNLWKWSGLIDDSKKSKR